MRIEGPSRTANATARSAAGRAAPGAAFDIGPGTTQARAASVSSAAPANGIEALLALQSVEDPTQGKKKAVRRARSLLDALEGLKADLLVGRISENRLNLLTALVAQAREDLEPGLDRLLDDIELRVKVELAKFGKYSPR